MEGGEDLFGGLGPDERFWVFVPCCDPGPDVTFQCLDAAMVAASQQLLGEVGKPPLDLVDPAGVGRRVVDMEAGGCVSQRRIAGLLWVP